MIRWDGWRVLLAALVPALVVAVAVLVWLW